LSASSPQLSPVCLVCLFLLAGHSTERASTNDGNSHAEIRRAYSEGLSPFFSPLFVPF
jgi:hypothetical protein